MQINYNNIAILKKIKTIPTEIKIMFIISEVVNLKSSVVSVVDIFVGVLGEIRGFSILLEILLISIELLATTF